MWIMKPTSRSQVWLDRDGHRNRNGNRNRNRNGHRNSNKNGNSFRDETETEMI